MTTESNIDYPTMSSPAIYRIRVRGRLNADRSDRLEGMHIESLARPNPYWRVAFPTRLLWPVFSMRFTTCIFR